MSCCGPYNDCGADCQCPPDCGCKVPGNDNQVRNCTRCCTNHGSAKSTVKTALKTLGISTVVAAAAIGTVRLVQNSLGKKSAAA